MAEVLLTFLALLVAATAPALAQPTQWQFFGPRGGYAGRAVESIDGAQVFVFGPRGGYAERQQRGRAEPGCASDRMASLEAK